MDEDKQKIDEDKQAKFRSCYIGEPDKGDEIMTFIVEGIANGGTLTEVCKAWDVNYGQMISWIQATPERAESYRVAMNSRAEWAQERIIQELRNIVTTDIRDFYNPDGTIKPVGDWPALFSTAVKSIEVQEIWGTVNTEEGNSREQVGVTKKIQFWDKTRNIELMGKNLQMFKDHVKIEASDTLEALIMASKKDGDA